MQHRTLPALCLVPGPLPNTLSYTPSTTYPARYWLRIAAAKGAAGAYVPSRPVCECKPTSDRWPAQNNWRRRTVRSDANRTPAGRSCAGLHMPTVLSAVSKCSRSVALGSLLDGWVTQQRLLGCRPSRNWDWCSFWSWRSVWASVVVAATGLRPTPTPWLSAALGDAL